MFKNGVKYRIPEGARTRSHQVGIAGSLTGESLSDLGVTEAFHFGSFAAGEMFRSKDKKGREVSFLIDRYSSSWVPIVELGDSHVAMRKELAELWEWSEETVTQKFVTVAAARCIPVSEALEICLERARKDALTTTSQSIV